MSSCNINNNSFKTASIRLIHLIRPSTTTPLPNNNNNNNDNNDNNNDNRKQYD